MQAADTLGDAETVKDVCMALRAPCHLALGLELPRALLHSDRACDQLPIHNPRRFNISWLSQVHLSAAADRPPVLHAYAALPIMLRTRSPLQASGHPWTHCLPAGQLPSPHCTDSVLALYLPMCSMCQPLCIRSLWCPAAVVALHHR